MLDKMMMQLGLYQFNINLAAYNNLQRTITYNWSEDEKLDGGSIFSFKNIKSETIKIAGVVYPFFKGGLAQVALMEAQAKLGLPLILVSAGGLVFGEWIIKSISEVQTIFYKYGAPKKINFTLTLNRFIK